MDFVALKEKVMGELPTAAETLKLYRNRGEKELGFGPRTAEGYAVDMAKAFGLGITDCLKAVGHALKTHKPITEAFDVDAVVDRLEELGHERGVTNRDELSIFIYECAKGYADGYEEGARIALMILGGAPTKN